MEGTELVGQGPDTVGPVGSVHVADPRDAGGWQGVGGAGGVPGTGNLLPRGPAEGAGDGPGEVVVGAGGARPLAGVVGVGEREGRAGWVGGASLVVQFVNI